MLLLSKIFAVLATIFAVLTYARYGYQIHKKISDPNPATVLLWFAEGVINALTYSGAVKDFWQTLITVTNAFLIFVIFFFTFFCKKFTKIGWVEIASLCSAVLIGVFWLVSRNDELSNLLLQVIYVISYVPVAVGILKGAKEHPLAWILALVSYSFATFAVILNFTGEIISLVYPVVNGVLGNGIIVLIIFYQKRKARLIL